ncbi:MAG: hypothetical protein JWO03_3970 [Bacteroidetes bacterium]|nr:hypothetical protein [Bacteroidota bacterium]
MNKYLVRLCHIACAVLLVCHLNSCKDPAIADKSNTFGLDPIGLAHLDSCPVIINTVSEMPLQASAVATGVLGSMNDPSLGRTYCGFYAQCLLSSNGAFFESGTVVDSVVLYLPYINDSSKYGPCARPIDVIVYEVSQYIDPTVIYHQNDVFNVYGQAIGRLNSYRPDLIDSTIVRHVTQSPQISIKLSNSFAQKLLSADSNSLSSSTNFINYMKGIYVTTNTANVGDGIVYLNLQSSRISMYYHNSASDSLQFDFPITSYSSTVNHFDHQYNGTPVQNAINHPSATGDATNYIQTGAGTKLKIQIPTLLSSVASIGKPIAVTKAELILPVQTSDTNLFPLPATVTFYRLINASDTSSLQQLNVYNNSGTGTLSTRIADDGSSYYCYVFNLTEFTQRVLNGYYANYGFYVEYSFTVRADRAIIYNDPLIAAKKSKLKITYTKLQ